MCITGKVRGCPRQQHTDTHLMQVINQIHEILRRAVAGAGRKVRESLITPRAVKRVLHHRQQFYVRKAHLERIGREQWSPRTTIYDLV